MIWLRFSFLILLVTFLMFFCCFFTYIALRRQAGVDDQDAALEAARVQRVPMVRLFLTERARKFDPTRDQVSIDKCAICLEKFQEDDGRLIAELNCNSKHIFHVDCLSNWIMTNDICPMCRDPILKKNGASG